MLVNRTTAACHVEVVQSTANFWIFAFIVARQEFFKERLLWSCDQIVQSRLAHFTTPKTQARERW